jgi:hypothetical protein
LVQSAANARFPPFLNGDGMLFLGETIVKKGLPPDLRRTRCEDPLWADLDWCALAGWEAAPVAACPVHPHDLFHRQLGVSAQPIDLPDRNCPTRVNSTFRLYSAPSLVL